MTRLQRFGRWNIGLAVLTSAVFGFGLAYAQVQPAANASVNEPDRTVLHNIALTHASAVDLTKVLRDLVSPEISKRMRLTADPRTNSLIVAASPADIDMIKRCIDLLDAPPRQVSAPGFRVFPLRHTTPDQTFEKGLGAVLSNGTGRFTVDRERRLVIVSGDDKVMQTVEAYFELLDRAIERPVPSEMRVRIVWLASGLSRKDAAPVPTDIMKAVEELTGLGISDMRMVSQTVIKVTSGTRFRAQGLADLDVPCSLSVEGMVGERPGSVPTLDLSLEATRLDGAKASLCRLATQIAAPEAHMVVLGVTPTEKSTSAFVVQILPAK